MPKHRTATSVDTMNKESFIRISNKIVVYHGNTNDIKLITRFLNRALIILAVVTAGCGLIIFDIPAIRSVL
ncbi:hypothetical protein D3C76_1693320 [compost metagenome]